MLCLLMFIRNSTLLGSMTFLMTGVIALLSQFYDLATLNVTSMGTVVRFSQPNMWAWMGDLYQKIKTLYLWLRFGVVEETTLGFVLEDTGSFAEDHGLGSLLQVGADGVAYFQSQGLLGMKGQNEASGKAGV